MRGDSQAFETAYWYLEGEEVRGPFDRVQYDALVADGTIDDGTMWWSDDPDDVPSPNRPATGDTPEEPLAIWGVAVLVGAYAAYLAIFLPLFACAQWGRAGARQAWWGPSPALNLDVDLVGVATALGPGSALHRAMALGGLLFLLAAWLRRGATAAWFLALVTSIVFFVQSFQASQAGRLGRGQLGPEPFAMGLALLAVALLLRRPSRRWCDVTLASEDATEGREPLTLDPPSGIRLLALPMAVMALGLAVCLPLAGRAHPLGASLHGIQGTTIPAGWATVLAIALGLAAGVWAWGAWRGRPWALALAALRGVVELAVGAGVGAESPNPDRLMPALLWLGALLLPGTRAWGGHQAPPRHGRPRTSPPGERGGA
ncbi:MAG: hypothetical protein R3F05_16785 [Planctomycetota bacterium]